jgi:ribose transport system permease protein
LLNNPRQRTSQQSSPVPGTDGPAATADPAARPRLQAWTGWLLGRYGMVGVWLAMSGIFLVVSPSSFGSVQALQSIFGSQEVLVFLALSALATLVAGEFDLSIASIMGLSATIIPVLSGLHHVNIWLSCTIALVASAACGAINAFFVVRVRVLSLVVTLGMATLLTGIAELISSSSAVSLLNNGFGRITLYNIGGLPISFYYGLAITVAFTFIMGWTPLGRHLLFVGANREVARLAGIRVNWIRAGSYVAAGLLAGLAGLILVSSDGGFDPTASADYLLPALAAVFLGTAVVQPGRFNPAGTFIAIYFLETGIFGLQLIGFSTWIQDVFYGAGLVISVALATVVRQRTTTE